MRIAFTMQQLRQWISKAIFFQRWIIILFVLLWVGFFGLGGYLYSFGPADIEKYAAVAQVIVDGKFVGTAFLVDKKRNLAFTAAHVVKGKDQLTLNFANAKRQLTVTGVVTLRDEKRDLDFALIRLNEDVSDIPPLPLADSGKVTVTDPVTVVGYPKGEYSVNPGYISATKENLFQVDATINPGNSGSPVLDKDTDTVVGMVITRLHEADKMNYMVPINRIKEYCSKNGYKLN